MTSVASEYCLYLRKSRADLEAESKGEGETFARHEKNLQEVARRMNITITECYKEQVSGETIIERPIMQHLLSEVEQGLWAGVLVMEVERLARGDTIDQGIVAQTFKYAGTKIITPMKIFDPHNEFDEEYFEFGLFMSRREFKTINRRLQRGRMDSIREGKFVGNIPPYGYDRIKLTNEKGYILEPNDQAVVIKMIYDWYCYGEKDESGIVNELGTALIARKLNTLQVPTAKGGPWTTATINSILRNPVYCGKIKWGSRPLQKRRINGKLVKERPRVSLEHIQIYPGRHKPLVTEDVWNLAQSFLAANPSKPISHKRKIMNPLSGLVVCAKCGRKMVRRPHKAASSPDTLMCQLPSCGNVSSFLHIVEEQVIIGLRTWLDHYRAQWENYIPDLSPTNHNTLNLKKNALMKLEKEISTLSSQVDNIHDLLEQGLYTSETFSERSQKINLRMTEARTLYAQLIKEIESEAKREESSADIIPSIENVIDVYYSTNDPEQRNTLLRSVLKEVKYLKQCGARSGGSLDGFEITLYPKLPRHH